MKNLYYVKYNNELYCKLYIDIDYDLGKPQNIMSQEFDIVLNNNDNIKDTGIYPVSFKKYNEHNMVNYMLVLDKLFELKIQNNKTKEKGKEKGKKDLPTYEEVIKEKV